MSQAGTPTQHPAGAFGPFLPGVAPTGAGPAASRWPLFGRSRTTPGSVPYATAGRSPALRQEPARRFRPPAGRAPRRPGRAPARRAAACASGPRARRPHRAAASPSICSARHGSGCGTLPYSWSSSTVNRCTTSGTSRGVQRVPPEVRRRRAPPGGCSGHGEPARSGHHDRAGAQWRSRFIADRARVAERTPDGAPLLCDRRAPRRIRAAASDRLRRRRRLLGRPGVLAQARHLRGLVRTDAPRAVLGGVLRTHRPPHAYRAARAVRRRLRAGGRRHHAPGVARRTVPLQHGDPPSTRRSP